MSTLKRFPFAFALVCLAFAVGLQAQTTAIEIATDAGRAEFSVRGQVSHVRVEVFAPSGELVFDSGEVAAAGVEWGMADGEGRRVAPGTYLATITVTDAAGRRRKRVEQVTVGGNAGQPAAAEALAAGEAAVTPQAVGPVSGAGTPGRLAKFTQPDTIGDSLLAESAGKVGVGTAAAPTARLHVNGAQPTTSALDGAGAGLLLQTTGGKGGNTSGTAGQQAGAGASISLLAGNGGDAPAGSKRGHGGNVVLQPGAAGGGGGAGGAHGSVLLAPSGVGNVGVGTSAPSSRLTVNGGSLQVIGGDVQVATPGKGLKFSDGSVQTKAAVSGLTGVAHNATLTGAGTPASPLSVAPLGVGSSQLANGAVGLSKLGTASIPTAGQVLTFNGSAMTWANLPTGGGGVTFFQHTRTAANTCGPSGAADYSLINHASVNGNANAKILVTALVGLTPSGNNSNSNLVVAYTGAASFGTCAAGRWVVKGGDVSVGAKFNVLVVN